ncbi:NAD(P)-dependent oxidoreductase [Coraliomargarita parva]|uniref:NAD(P)-dependent oxidoreductase n=1 Tax=Coraliomargarita parva TaxID=3014050 RepID=UPI0022B2FD51|nr:NAD(P)-dependent oxidoreductase [Coraliomargarita parva]
MKLLAAISERSKKAFLQGRPFPNLDGYEIQEVDVTGFSGEQWLQCLREEQPDVLVAGWDTPSIPKVIAEDPNDSIRYVCYFAGSVRQLVPRSMIERGVIVSNWGSQISYTIAEHVMLLTLGALRRVVDWPDLMMGDSRNAKARLNAQSLRHRRVGIHGFGVIARELVPMLRSFQVASITAYSEGVPSSLFEVNGVQEAQSLKSLFAGADVLIELEALRESSELSVNEAILRELPEGAVFVNVGRGRVVDEAALTRVAMEKSLRVGLDVYFEEPLSKDSPLHQVSGIVLSPHIGGPTTDAYRYCADFAFENLKRYLVGEPVQAAITLEIYDRST